MSLESPTGYEQLRPADAALVDSICDRFERAWKGISKEGEPPGIQPYLAGQPESVQSVLARELIALDRAYRERRGDTITAERYLNLLSERDVAREQGAGTVGNWPELPGLQIVKVLGSGGMGVVYKAWQPALDRYVAVKMLRHANLADAEHRERFAREARAVARLQHPQVVQVFAVGELLGLNGGTPLPYFVMEFVGGGNLAEALCGQPQHPRAAAQLLETLARALHFAHQQGIVHRDLKPGNVLIQESGGMEKKHNGSPDSPRQFASLQPKITDFGLAKLGIGSDLTQTGDTLGTPSYMAPEQTDNNSGEVTPLTDVYGLGAIFYETLTGRPPFQADTALATILQVRHDEPVSPRRLQPTVPLELETICLKCLQKGPGQRYSSAESLADDLRRFQEGRPILARPVSIAQRVGKWMRRHPAAAGLAAVSSLGAVLLLAILLISDVQIRQQQRVTKAALDAERLTLYFHRIRLSQAALQGNNPRQAESDLQACRPAGDQRDLRGWEWHYLHRQCHTELVSWEGKDHPALAFQADGNVASFGSDGMLKVWDFTAGKFIISKKIFPPAESFFAAISPDGRTLASRYENTLKIYSLAEGKVLHSIPGSEAVFSTDGRRMAAIAGGDKWVRIHDLTTGKTIRTCRLSGKLDCAYAFHADGLWQAVVNPDHTIRVWNVETGKDQFTAYAQSTGNVSPYFSQDGRWLAAGGRDGVIKIWGGNRGEVQSSFQAHPGYISCLAFSADNRQLASADFTGSVKVWDLQGHEIRTLPGHGVSVGNIAFSHDGHLLATSGFNDTVKVWDIARDVQAVEVLHNNLNMHSVGFSPDSRRIVTAATEQTLSVWDAETGKVLMDLPEKMGTIRHAAFAKDGKRLRAWNLAGALREWNSTTAKEVRSRQGFITGKSTLHQVSPGEAYFAVIEGKNIKLHDAATGEVLRVLQGHTDRISMMTFSLDDRYLGAVSHDDTIKVWETATGRECCTFRGHTDRVRCLCFSADGSRMASGGMETLIRIWDAQTGQELRTLENPFGRQVESVAFSPDGKRLASGSLRASVSLWDTESGQEVLEIPTAHALVIFVTFSPDGSRLAALCLDGTVLVWDSSSPSLGAGRD